MENLQQESHFITNSAMSHKDCERKPENIVKDKNKIWKRSVYLNKERRASIKNFTDHEYVRSNNFENCVVCANRTCIRCEQCRRAMCVTYKRCCFEFYHKAKQFEDIQRAPVWRCWNATRVFVDGNIAAGKSNFLKYLAANTDHASINVCTGMHNRLIQPLFNLSNECKTDMHRWMFTLSTLVYTNYLMGLVDDKVNCIVSETSIDVYNMILNHTAEVLKCISSTESMVLNEIFQTIRALLKYDIIVYVQSTPEACFKRIAESHAYSDQLKSMPIEFFSRLHEMLENWVNNVSKYVPLFIVHDVEDEALQQQEYEKCTAKLLLYLHKKYQKKM